MTAGRYAGGDAQIQFISKEHGSTLRDKWNLRYCGLDSSSAPALRLAGAPELGFQTKVRSARLHRRIQLRIMLKTASPIEHPNEVPGGGGAITGLGDGRVEELLCKVDLSVTEIVGELRVQLNQPDSGRDQGSTRYLFHG